MGKADGVYDEDSVIVDKSDGTRVGVEGASVGERDGDGVGYIVGIVLGDFDGSIVGNFEGPRVGSVVGDAVNGMPSSTKSLKYAFG